MPDLMQDELAVDSASPDPEIRMRLDRLGWILQMAIHDQDNAWQAAGKWLEERWKRGLACSGGYSISERISNLVLLWNIQAPAQDMAASVRYMIEKDAYQLLGSLEYHGESKTNNHILNNARALILAGSFLGDGRFYEAGCWILDNQLRKHVSADGVVREASTHYQWVVTRWIMETGFVFHSQDTVRLEKLRPLLNSMLDVCEAMQLGSGHDTYLPLIGDISPDFPPRLYGGMTRLGFALLGGGEGIESASRDSVGLWSHFFKGRDGAAQKNWHADDNSWVRMNHERWHLLAHADMHTDDNRATHGHHDLFSFELSFGNIPVVIDPGRKDYLAGRDEEEAGILEEWHNTILVDSCRTGFVPRGYMPVPWLKKNRTRPRVMAGEGSLSIRLDGPVEVPGVSCIKRVLNLADGGRVLVTSQIMKKHVRPTNVRLVLYLAGNACLTDEGLELRVGSTSFLLRWQGMGCPSLRNSCRYISYGVSEPCARLEWDVTTTQAEWFSTIEIIAQEGVA